MYRVRFGGSRYSLMNKLLVKRALKSLSTCCIGEDLHS